MSSPIDNELAPTENGARLPALGSPEQPQFLARVKETLEVLLGRRGGSNWDRAVTFRDLYNLGISPGGTSGFGGPLTIDAPTGAIIPGGTVGGSAGLFDELLRQSPGYKNLMTAIGSAEDLAMLPDEFRQLLQHALADAARERQADIQTIERKVQNSTKSLASRLTEITAALEKTAAGVRQFDGAYADNMRAVATSIKQVTAALGNLGEVTVEEKFTAQADVNTGLLGQWSLKIQTNPANGQAPVIAGIDLAVTSPVAGPGTSALIFMAEKFGFYTNNGTVLPFGIDNAGNIFVNGTLRVNDGGNTLSDLANGLRSLTLQASSQVFQINKNGTNSPGSITLDAKASNLSGTPNWTIPNGTATLSAGSSGYSKVLNFANMSTDTVTVRVELGGYVDTITIVKVREGSDAITGFLTNEAVNVPADSAGTVSDYGGTAGVFRVYDGSVDVTGNGQVAYSIVNQNGMTVALGPTTGSYGAASMTADTATATLRATYKGVVIDKILNVTKAKAGAQGPQGPQGNTGSTGQRGNMDIAVSGYSGYSGVDTATANTIFLNATGFWRQERDRMTLYNSATSETRVFLGSSWQTVAAYINGNMVVNGTLSANVLSGGQISGVTMNINGNFRVFADGTSQLYNANLTRCAASNGDAPGLDAFSATSSGSGAAIKTNGGSSGNALVIAGGINGIVQTGGGGNFLRTIVASSDAAYDLGGPSNRFVNVYATSGTITTSDERTKYDIQSSDLGLDFINDLEPVRFKQLVAENIVTDNWVELEPAKEFPDDFGNLVQLAAVVENQPIITPRKGTRFHYGLKADQVRAALMKHKASDSAIWVLTDKNDPKSMQALRYDQLITPTIRAVQQVDDRVDAHQEEIDGLKATIADLQKEMQRLAGLISKR
jgi:hypothetical protein